MRRPLLVALFPLLVLCTAPSPAQLAWTRDAANPVLNVFTGSPDDPGGLRFAVSPSVLYDSADGVFRMWFVSLSRNPGAVLSISEALSVDGVRWFVGTRNPVITGDSGASIYTVCVIRDAQGYKCYYDLYQTSIHLATSPDGVQWEKHPGGPVLTGGAAPWMAAVGAPAVIRDGDVYRMWFNGYSGTQWSIGYATSPDGIAWSLASPDPVLTAGSPGAFNEAGVCRPGVAKHGGRFHMLFTGHSGLLVGRVGYAWSTDGSAWHMPGVNPVLGLGAYGSWEEASVMSSCLMVKDGAFRSWYSSIESADWQTGRWQIGHAQAPVVAVSVEPAPAGRPDEIRLEANYPDPFNGSTRLVYRLPEPARVTLEVYDALGRLVATLAGGWRPAGEHQAGWDGLSVDHTPAASGVYMARLEAVLSSGRVSRSEEKMLLTR